jgi:A/G-specific adenine glycosylase
MGDFAARVIAWQEGHGRHDLPWQNTRDPYRIWLSEIMLQQTQVSTVVPYYQRFLARCADVAALAELATEEVMGLWSGLGYYARARNLHRCARCVVEAHGGQFPRTPNEIASLPGIGRSTAAAIAAFAYGTRAAILDGNVKRVLCRAFGITGFPGDKTVENRLWELAESLLPESGIERYTQGLMDLGATVCTRNRPACLLCPLTETCVARLETRVAELPERRPKKATPQRTATVLILRHDGAVLLEQRPPAGIWGGLLSLPETESNGPSLADDVQRRFGLDLVAVQELPPVQHAFTHFKLELRPLLCEVAPGARSAHEADGKWQPLAELNSAPLPAPVRRLLQQVADENVAPA